MTDKHQFGSSDEHDSAGQPWAGREFASNNFAEDDGTASAMFLDAVAAFRATELFSEERAHALRKAVDVVRITRFLVPLVPQAGEVGTTANGLAVDKTQELSIVHLEGPDNTRALPVFSSVAAMQAWRAEARPVPTSGLQVARAAVDDAVDLIVIDPTSESELVLRARTFEAIADERLWIPPFLDSDLARAFNAPAEGDPFVRRVTLSAGDPDARGMGPELVVEVQMVSGLSQAEVEKVMGKLTGAWGEVTTLNQRISSMLVRVVAAE